MNVLITAPSLDVNKNVSGISAVVNTIIDNNKENNYVHHLAGREDGSTGILQRIVSVGKSYWTLVNVLRKKDINLIHLNLPLNPSSIYREYISFHIAKIFRKKIMLHLHGGKYLLQRPSGWLLKEMISHMYKQSESVVCLSMIEKEIIEKAYELNKVDVLENTVDDVYMHLDNQSSVNKDLTVLFMGRLHESKGIHVILASIKTLLEKGHRNIQFVFCGMGPLLNEVLQMEKVYPEQVSYLGIVCGKLKTAIIARAQIFILPSLYGEGLPMSLLEAMAAGLVPIVTNDGSMSQVVTHNETGFIIQKNNAPALTSQIELLMADPDNRKRIATNTKAYAANKFSISSYVQSLNELYRLSVA